MTDDDVLLDDLVDLTRYVRTPSGVKRYHKPIGSPIGGGTEAPVHALLSAERVLHPQNGDILHGKVAGMDAGFTLQVTALEGVWTTKYGTQPPEKLADSIASGLFETDLPPDVVKEIRRDATLRALDAVKDKINRYPEYTAKIDKKVWHEPTRDELANLFGDDDEKTFVWAKGLGAWAGPEGPVVVLKSNSGDVVEVDLIKEAYAPDTRTRPILNNYPNGIMRLTEGLAWSRQVAGGAEGLRKGPVYVAVPDPGKWDAPAANGGEVIAYTRFSSGDITFNPRYLYNDAQDPADNLSGGWWSPAGRKAPSVEAYAILHELGHVDDARLGHTVGEPNSDEPVPTIAADTLYAAAKTMGADQYGSSSPWEMYAEAFVTFYGLKAPGNVRYLTSYPEKVETGMQRIAAMYAEQYGWKK